MKGAEGRLRLDSEMKDAENFRVFPIFPRLPPYGDETMKKCMVLASVAGLAGMAMGVSSSVVGYVTKDIGRSSYVLTAVQFEGVNGETTVDDIVSTSDAGTQSWNPDDTNVDGWYNTAATLMIPNGFGGYDYYYYASDGYDEDADEQYPGWCDMYGYVQKNVTVPAGVGIWFRTGAAATVTFTK